MDQKSQNDLKSRVMEVLTAGHVGKENAIDMGALFEAVFKEGWKNKINDTRPLRTVIEALRDAGSAIGSCPRGYYIMRSDTELKDYFRREEHNAIGRLKKISRMKRISLGQYLGQLQLGLAAATVGKEAR
jgi:hypothetical protein